MESADKDLNKELWIVGDLKAAVIFLGNLLSTIAADLFNLNLVLSTYWDMWVQDTPRPANSSRQFILH